MSKQAISTAPSPAGLLTPAQAANFLGLKNRGTLAVWRSTKRYALSYVKVGHLVRYRVSDLQSFLDSRRVEVEMHA